MWCMHYLPYAVFAISPTPTYPFLQTSVSVYDELACLVSYFILWMNALHIWMLLGRSTVLLGCNYRHFSLIEVLINYLKNVLEKSYPLCRAKCYAPLFLWWILWFLLCNEHHVLCWYYSVMITLYIKMVVVRQCTHYMKRTPTFKHLTRWDLLERWLKSPSGINSGNSSQEDLLLNPWRSREYCRVSSCYKFCWDDSDYSWVPRIWQLLTNFLVFFDRFLFVFQ